MSVKLISGEGNLQRIPYGNRETWCVLPRMFPAELPAPSHVLPRMHSLWKYSILPMRCQGCSLWNYLPLPTCCPGCSLRNYPLLPMRCPRCSLWNYLLLPTCCPGCAPCGITCCFPCAAQDAPYGITGSFPCPATATGPYLVRF